MLRAWILVVVLVTTIAGCGLVEQAAEMADAASPDTSRSSGTPDPASKDADAGTVNPRKTIRTAVRKVPDSGAVDYGFTLRAADLDLQVTTGTFEIDSRSSAATTRFTEWTDSSRKYTMHTTSIGSVTYMQMETWRGAEKGCWVPLRQGFAPAGVQALSRRKPAFLAVLEEVRPAPWGEATASGSMPAILPLREVLTLMPEKGVEALGFKKRKPSRRQDVAVLLEIEDSRLARMTITGFNIREALHMGKRGVSRDSDHFAQGLNIELSYPLDATPREIRRPDPDLVMTREEALSGRGCHETRTL